MMMIAISEKIFQNITGKLEKSHILLSQFLVVLLPPNYMPPMGKKRCYKIRADHK